MVKIDRRLNLVQTIETDAGTCHIHSTPLSREVWETYFLVLSKTYAAILSEGLTVISGPSMCALLLKSIAMTLGMWTGPEGVEKGLLPEIRRLTNVMLLTDKGWETLPFEEALRRELIDEETLSIIMGTIVFFMCVSAVLRGKPSRPKLTLMLTGLASLWGAQTSSLDVMEYAASLPTSMPVASSGETRPASSVPH